MKNSLLAATGLVGLVLLSIAGPTSAADLPAYKAPPPPKPSCARFAGLYAGGNVGWVRYNANLEDRNNFVSFPFAIGGTSTYTGNASSTTYGAQVGYNFQYHCMVFGAEADWSWANADVDSVAHPNFLGAPAAVGTVNGHLKSFTTLRTRAGIVIDQLLLYITGGAAWMKTSH